MSWPWACPIQAFSTLPRLQIVAHHLYPQSCFVAFSHSGSLLKWTCSCIKGRTYWCLRTTSGPWPALKSGGSLHFVFHCGISNVAIPLWRFDFKTIASSFPDTSSNLLKKKPRKKASSSAFWTCCILICNMQMYIDFKHVNRRIFHICSPFTVTCVKQINNVFPWWCEIHSECACPNYHNASFNEGSPELL